ncbi:hypothetical protein LSH36_589g02075 [Paralvinella palmiformis]|uniref:Uncharacterized protein n=1 Tax=Paralvinella palmiformis TaxID=53620 RepID=A0AAD9MUW8_9ANNE|nr:hypothetical protein LSH36_589g02075 [Paralvinella palmiformis]
MTSLFGKRDGYALLNQSDDVHLLDAEEGLEDQATFDSRFNMAATDPKPGSSTAPASDQPDTSAALNIPNENGRLEFLDLREPVCRQSSMIDYQDSTETEENLKCVVSSILFVIIVIAVILVAFLINPSV